MIAEFIFSYEYDILIKSDANHLVDVLENHNLITNEMGVTCEQLKKEIYNNDNDISKKLMMSISRSIDEKQVLAIMNEYYGIKSYEETIAE